MNPNIIRYKSQLARINKRIQDFQSKCPHLCVTKTPGAITGNLDDNVYWTDHHCQDCDKRWQIK